MHAGDSFSNLQLSSEQITPLHAVLLEGVARRYRLLRQGVNVVFFTVLWFVLLGCYLQPWWPLPAASGTASSLSLSLAR